MKEAMGQVKEMWLESSRFPHRAHRPLEAIARVKIWILGGTLDFQTSEKSVSAALADSEWLRDLAEYSADYFSNQEITSS
jgi:hypothetical protein